MPLNPNPVGSSIASYIQTIVPPAGTAITTAQLTTMWQQIMTLIYNDLKANALITSVIPSDAIATTGGPAAQVGPTAAVDINGGIT